MLIKKILYFTLFLLYSSLFSNITYSANYTSYQFNDDDSVSILKGNVHIQTEDFDIKGDSFELKGKDFRFIEGQGSIKGNMKEENIYFESDEFYYDQELKIVTFRGNVDIILDEEDNEDKDSTVIQANKMKYDQNIELLTAFSHVKLYQENGLFARSEYLQFNQNSSIVKLTGKPFALKDDEQFSSDEMNINIDTQDIELIGDINADISE